MYGLTGFQNEVVEIVLEGLKVAARAVENAQAMDALAARLKAEALASAEGSNETTRRANAEVALSENDEYKNAIGQATTYRLLRENALAEVEAAKIAARFMVATIAAGASE